MKTNTKLSLKKTPTGINGLDEITNGGLPTGRPTLVCGNAGCGKTLMAIQFLVKGITDYKEPGVFMSFEESTKDLSENVVSLGFDLPTLLKEKKLRIDHVKIDKSEIEETGEYDLEGLFIRLNHAIDSIGARRVVLDTVESLFSNFDNPLVLRSEIRRLFHFLKEKGVTAIITGERGEKTLTRQGLEEYVSDCVILLDFRVDDQIATRRLRIVKYRGSTHGTNEYPFLIDEKGFSVVPITSLSLDHKVSSDVISTGLPALDKLFDRGGYYKGSSVLVSGTSGTAKTTLAAYFAAAACKRGEKVLFFAFEESPDQIVRNLISVGINLKPYLKSNLLHILSTRPSHQGLEMHLLTVHKAVEEFKPDCVIIDPVSNLITVGNISEVRSMLIRMIDILKVNGITALFTSLTQQHQSGINQLTEESISSLVDTWIELKNEELNGERIRTIFVLKARGMGHTNEVKEFIITKNGIEIYDNQRGPSGLLRGLERKSNGTSSKTPITGEKKFKVGKENKKTIA